MERAAGGPAPPDGRGDGIVEEGRTGEAPEGRSPSCSAHTVDGFQGREKEVVLVSLVRSNEQGEIGFLDEPRRFNVALTHARRKVIVVGDARTVRSGEVFDAFVGYAEAQGRVHRL